MLHSFELGSKLLWFSLWFHVLQSWLRSHLVPIGGAYYYKWGLKSRVQDMVDHMKIHTSNKPLRSSHPFDELPSHHFWWVTPSQCGNFDTHPVKEMLQVRSRRSSQTHLANESMSMGAGKFSCYPQLCKLHRHNGMFCPFI